MINSGKTNEHERDIKGKGLSARRVSRMETSGERKVVIGIIKCYNMVLLFENSVCKGVQSCPSEKKRNNVN